ncbi:cytochrome P450 2K1-like isoform X2 [Latimeria chalumnae]|uniref:cytochrome P450 2K1-like isoform X2 n=1 Tax=Latimeria chalumnae TaxID=7897 RepID=UPI00313DBE27
MFLISLLQENAISFSLLFIVSLIFLYYRFLERKKSSPYSFPPGPTPLPIIGSLHLLDMKKPQLTLTKFGEQYNGFYTIYLGLQKYVVLAGYEVMKDALVNHPDEFADRGRSPVFNKVLKDNGQPFDATVSINAAVSNIICSIVFGKRFDYDDKTFLHLINLNNDIVTFGGSPHAMLYNSFPFLEFFPGDHHKVFKALVELRDFAKRLGEEHKSKLNAKDIRSYIDAFFVKQQKEDITNGVSYFNEEHFLATIENLFVAGTDTTSNTLKWGLLLMMKYPEIQERVHEEIMEVIGCERSAVSEDRKDMPYTNAVMYEIQRFANIVPMGLPHQTSTDVHFRGYFLPKETQIIPLLTSVLYDKTQWEKPEEFYPSHFLDAEGKFVKKDAFMPFSAGRRICVGENLAKMEFFLFFVTLLQIFKFSPPPGVTERDLDLTPCFGVTSSPVPYKLCAVPY